ncbi:hypothetical protein Clim_0370 [Chlorobium limicola DSM 245]|uniref:Uncharacterized protein n=1 Tax=Chlorobium limicola (strain DSM 245 / NBRC 103803 / 6330) TaxID=290315 RepID=B3EFI0_CHLL2|nr:hypothetical protein Clim_0370 [Chlorobium limicola DSM 245]
MNVKRFSCGFSLICTNWSLFVNREKFQDLQGNNSKRKQADT